MSGKLILRYPDLSCLTFSSRAASETYDKEQEFEEVTVNFLEAIDALYPVLATWVLSHLLKILSIRSMLSRYSVEVLSIEVNLIS